MKQELKHDYLVHIEHSKETPVFHRIKFDETSIFLTQASYSKLTTGKINQGHHYRVFPWTDFRAKAFLGFELGQRSPALGEASLIGSFKPEGDDLTEVKYHSFSGKAYFESAIEELEAQRSSTPSANEEVTGSSKAPKVRESSRLSKKLIDASNFMKMKEVIPTGAQGKAIYGEGNYIIDGAAGTGKSTTVLHKIKLLQLQSNISSDRICIIVKNQKIVQVFRALLDNLGISGIQTFSQKDFVSSNYANLAAIDENLLESIKEHVEQYVNEFESCTNLSKLTARSSSQHESSNLLRGSISFQEQYGMFLQSCDQYCLDKARLAQLIVSMKKAHVEELNEFQRKFEANLLARKGKPVLGRVKSSRKDVSLNLSDQAIVREETFKKKNELSQKVQKKSAENKDNLDRKLAHLQHQKEKLIEELCSLANLQAVFEPGFPVEIVSRYLNKSFPHLKSYHTVIVDEAQDVAKSAIELIRLNSSNTILVGDESQTELDSGVGSWKNVLFYGSEFSLKGRPNIFSLRHNFRQTYELGTVSYNYRQLMLERSVENIKEDYFGDQIGYMKPKLVRIQRGDDFIRLIETKLAYIKSQFVGHFPLVIFYENDASLYRFQELIGNNYSMCIDQTKTDGKDIMLVSVNQIAGREFPVVIAPLANKTRHSMVYIMLSRAKIDLTLALSSSNEVNPYAQRLIDEGLITHQR